MPTYHIFSMHCTRHELVLAHARVRTHTHTYTHTFNMLMYTHFPLLLS